MGQPNPYPGWINNQNPRWNQNSTQGAQAQQPRKPSPLEEAFTQFLKISQSSFENMQSTAVNQGASIKNLETQIGQLSKLITNLSKDYAGNTIDNSIKEAYQSVLRPSGIIKDVSIKIKDLIFRVDFVIIDIEEDADVPVILGIPFLATSRAVIDMEKDELKLRMRDKEQLIRIQKGKDDWCCRIDVKEPKSHGRRMKVTMKELEAGLAKLEMKEKPCPYLDMTDIKKEDIWVRRWGRLRKVAVKSKLGVNKIEIKKPEKCNIKIKFKKVIDYSKQPAKVKWISVPREPERTYPPK
ncbi:unnamed protein product [Trifolium pratense]|uniref:Uncharacterized protein n=1 Tax=Trifolium pratense TaxID=57577 RepID=A0ACB0LTR3_TRIPR|nr:unnamed protein product [Trifolium pratense]